MLLVELESRGTMQGFRQSPAIKEFGALLARFLRARRACICITTR